jgi:hypothetical protein
MWGVLAINLASPGVVALNGHLKGEDYSHFYVLGRLVLDGETAYLYDPIAQAAYMRTAIPGAPSAYFVPVYGPQVALLFAPLASLPYLASLALWWAATIVVYFVCCFAVLRACPMLQRRRADVALALLASPALWQLVVHGQNSVLALGALTGGWLSLRTGRSWAAGLLFGVLFYKPQLGLVAAITLLLTGHWKAVAGMAMSAAAQLSAAWLFLGLPVLDAYLRMLAALPEIASLLEPKPYLLHTFRAFFAMLPIGAGYAVLLWLVSSAVLIALLVRRWPSPRAIVGRNLSDPAESAGVGRVLFDPAGPSNPAARDAGLGFALMLIATVLISPHTSVYDLVILAPALLLIVDRMLARQNAAGQEGTPDRVGYALAAGVFVLPLLPSASQYLAFQPSVLCLTWLFLRNSRTPGPAAEQA